MNKVKYCPACGKNNVTELRKLENYPIIIFPVDENITTNIDSKDLTIEYCHECNHLFQLDINFDFNELLYKKYYKYYPYSNIECFVDVYRKPFENIFNLIKIDKQEKKLLEIGVSSGEQLDFFKKAGFNSLGITPQEVTDKDIISGFYEEYSFENNYFDVIVSRFNLEHIIDIDRFMEKIFSELNDNGLFIVQVPNVKYYMKENILNFFAHEHIHYFNEYSIKELFERNNFFIESIHHFDSPSIIIVGRALKESVNFVNEHNKNSDEITKEISEIINNNKRVIVYGASLSLSKIIYDNKFKEFDETKVVFVDDNDLVKNLCMPFFKNNIVSYNDLEILETDTIILTLNSIYHNKIIERMISDGYKNKIYCINKNGLELIDI